MEFTPSQATQILLQIHQDQWKWLKIERFRPEAFADTESRYAALERHHAEETQRMIEVIAGLCHTIQSMAEGGDLTRHDSELPRR